MIDALLSGSHSIGRMQNLTNNWDRLSDKRLGRLKATNTVKFIVD